MVNRRNRKIAPAIPYLFVHCVSNGAINTTPSPLTWGCVDMITSEMHYVEGDDRVVVNRGGAGIYDMIITLCAEKVTGAPTHVVMQLYVNGVAVPEAITCGYVGGSLEHASITLIYAGYFNEGDYVQTYISVDAGTAQITPHTGRAISRGVPMRGWNNESGGRDRIKGARR